MTKKLTKKLISIFLSLLMILSLIPTGMTAFAAATDGNCYFCGHSLDSHKDKSGNELSSDVTKVGSCSQCSGTPECFDFAWAIALEGDNNPMNYPTQHQCSDTFLIHYMITADNGNKFRCKQYKFDSTKEKWFALVNTKSIDNTKLPEGATAGDGKFYMENPYSPGTYIECAYDSVDFTTTHYYCELCQMGRSSFISNDGNDVAEHIWTAHDGDINYVMAFAHECGDAEYLCGDPECPNTPAGLCGLCSECGHPWFKHDAEADRCTLCNGINSCYEKIQGGQCVLDAGHDGEHDPWLTITNTYDINAILTKVVGEFKDAEEPDNYGVKISGNATDGFSYVYNNRGVKLNAVLKTVKQKGTEYSVEILGESGNPNSFTFVFDSQGKLTACYQAGYMIGGSGVSNYYAYPYTHVHTWNNGTCTLDGTTCSHTNMTTSDATCGTCGITNPSYVSPHTHTFDTTKWTSDTTSHWHAATCGHSSEKSDLANHSGGTATCTALAKCSVCQAEYGQLAPHSFNTTASTSLASNATCTAAATYYVKCDNCTAVSNTKTVSVGQPLGHSYATTWTSDTTSHWHAATCGHSSEKSSLANHSGGTATCTALAKCSVCQAEYGQLAPHSFNTTASTSKATDATCTEAATYYVKCDNCTAVSTTKTVSVGQPLGHSYGTTASSSLSSNATCTEAATYYVKCNNCTVVSTTKTVSVGQPNGHSYGTVASTTKATDATCTEAATYYVQCDNCTAVDTVKTVPVGQPNGHSYGKTGASRYTCTVCTTENTTLKIQAELDDAKAEAINAIDEAVGEYNDSALLNYVANAKTGINNATNKSTVLANKNIALDTIKLMQARIDAIAEVEKALGECEDANAVAIANQAKADINSATNIENIAPIKNQAITDINDAIALAKAKASAKEAIDKALGNTKNEKAIDVADKAKKDIDDAKTISEVESIKNKAVTDIKNILTPAPTPTPGPAPAPAPEEHKHTPVIIPAVASTTEKEGKTEGQKCSQCGEILVAQTTVPKLTYIKSKSVKKIKMYKTASTNSSAVMNIEKGKAVKIFEIKGTWYKVKCDGKVGYVKSSSLTWTGKIKTKKSNLILRKSPSSKSKKLDSYPNGKKVTVIASTKNGWYKVKVKDGKKTKTGYMSAKYIK